MVEITKKSSPQQGLGPTSPTKIDNKGSRVQDMPRFQVDNITGADQFQRMGNNYSKKSPFADLKIGDYGSAMSIFP